MPDVHLMVQSVTDLPSLLGQNTPPFTAFTGFVVNLLVFSIFYFNNKSIGETKGVDEHFHHKHARF